MYLWSRTDWRPYWGYYLPDTGTRDNALICFVFWNLHLHLQESRSPYPGPVCQEITWTLSITHSTSKFHCPKTNNKTALIIFLEQVTVQAFSLGVVKRHLVSNCHKFPSSCNGVFHLNVKGVGSVLVYDIVPEKLTLKKSTFSQTEQTYLMLFTLKYY